jgi:cell division protein FtsB
MSSATNGVFKTALLNWGVNTYKFLVLLLAVSVPLGAIAYLQAFGDPQLKANAIHFHEVAIAFALLISAFVTWVAFQNYKNSGEPFLRFVTLAFLSFVLLYAPHGVMSRASAHCLTLFLIFGPISRLAMAIYLFVGLLRFKREPDDEAVRTKGSRWWPHVLLFVVGGLVVYAVGSQRDFSVPEVKAIEAASLVVLIASVLLMLFRGIRKLLMWYHMFALLLFIQASAAFLLGRPWNHMWWLAHAISATGFFVLGYAVMRAQQTSGSFSTIYSEVELYATLRARTEELKAANQQLEENSRQLVDALEERDREAKEKERLIRDLEEALSKVRTLSGLLPVCSSCKNIRDDQGYWTQMEAYISDHSEAEFSHSMCPPCAQRLYPEVYARLCAEKV